MGGGLVAFIKIAYPPYNTRLRIHQSHALAIAEALVLPRANHNCRATGEGVASFDTSIHSFKAIPAYRNIDGSIGTPSFLDVIPIFVICEDSAMYTFFLVLVAQAEGLVGGLAGWFRHGNLGNILWGC